MNEKAKFVISKSKLIEQFQKAQNLADSVSYSLKTNYEIGQLLEDLTNCQFSIHSLEASNLIKDKSRCWFFAQGWNKEDIKNLIEKGTNSFVLDNQKDLESLTNFLKISNHKINLLLRMRLKENTIHTGKHFVFGFLSKQVNELIPKLKQNKNIDQLGIHFHRKTQNISEWSLKEELQDSINQKTLNNITLVNMGGGIPSIYKNYKAETLEYIFSKIKELKQWLNSQNIKMTLEPGRFIAAPPVKLVTTIKNIYNNNIIINSSIYNSAMDTFVAHIRLLVEGEVDSKQGQPYTIKGCTPDSLDIFRYRVFLGKEPKIRDKIIFLYAGAYNFSTEFCKLPKLKTEVTE